ncbi:MAG: hypothetical protein AB7O77_17750, partial [Phycisphaerales bacterium]
MDSFDRKRNWTLGMCVAAGVFLTSVVAVQADLFTYQYQDGDYKMVSRQGAPGMHMSQVCHPGFCYEVDCNLCHTAGTATSDVRSRGFDEGRHWREYFPPRTVPLPAGQSLAWGNERLERRDGGIALVNSRGESVRRFPANAIVLVDRARRPAHLVWPGDRPPAR